MKTVLLVLAFLGPIQRLDDAAMAAVQASRSPALERPMRVASDAGRPVVVFGGLLAVALLDGAQGVTTARLALLALLPTNLIVEGLKRWTDRTRPDGEHKRSNASFPSSHAANAFALATVLARRWRRWAPVFVGVAGIVAFSRVYLNRHYVSDAVVGAVIGVACAILVEAWQARRRVPVTVKVPAAGETAKI
jgi:undecaprenyl-diphosphatase